MVMLSSTSKTMKVRGAQVTVAAVTERSKIARGTWQPRWVVYVRAPRRLQAQRKNCTTLAEVEAFIVEQLQQVYAERVEDYERFGGRKPGQWRAPKIDLSDLDESMPLAPLPEPDEEPRYSGHGRKYASRSGKLFPGVNWNGPCTCPLCAPRFALQPRRMNADALIDKYRDVERVYWAFYDKRRPHEEAAYEAKRALIQRHMDRIRRMYGC